MPLNGATSRSRTREAGARRSRLAHRSVAAILAALAACAERPLTAVAPCTRTSLGQQFVLDPPLSTAGLSRLEIVVLLASVPSSELVDAIDADLSRARTLLSRGQIEDGGRREYRSLGARRVRSPPGPRAARRRPPSGQRAAAALSPRPAPSRGRRGGRRARLVLRRRVGDARARLRRLGRRPRRRDDPRDASAGLPAPLRVRGSRRRRTPAGVVHLGGLGRRRPVRRGDALRSEPRSLRRGARRRWTDAPLRRRDRPVRAAVHEQRRLRRRGALRSPHPRRGRRRVRTPHPGRATQGAARRVREADVRLSSRGGRG